MSANLPLALEPRCLAAAVLGLMLAKAAVAFPLGRYRRALNAPRIAFALALPQAASSASCCSGGARAGALTQGGSRDLGDRRCRWPATPLLFAVSESLLIPGWQPRRPSRRRSTTPPAPVIICGFGRVGQIVGRVLRMQRIAFTALEQNAEQVEAVRRFGNQGLLRQPAAARPAARRGAERARLLVVALDDTGGDAEPGRYRRGATSRSSKSWSRPQPRHAHLLMDRGVTRWCARRFGSSLRMSEMTLEDLGVRAGRRRSGDRAVPRL